MADNNIVEEAVSPNNLSARLVACLAARDHAGLTALYVEDAVLLPPGRAAVNGRREIGQFWRELAGRIDQVRAETTDIRTLGSDDLLEIGTLAFRLPDVAPTPTTGKYLVAWTRTPLGWRITHDIWNLDA